MIPVPRELRELITWGAIPPFFIVPLSASSVTEGTRRQVRVGSSLGPRAPAGRAATRRRATQGCKMSIDSVRSLGLFGTEPILTNARSLLKV